MPMNKPRINIIGSGKLGRTLIRLFVDQQGVEIGDVFNRSPAHSQAAIEFWGAGRRCDTIGEMHDADIWLLATPDDAIAGVVKTLTKGQQNWANTVVFHSSGLHSSCVLEALQERGAKVASVHPVHSFARPEQSLRSYSGTVCTIEGDSGATNILSELFTQIGSTVIPIQASGKALYHAATVMGSNYLVALHQVALDMLEQAGINRSQAQQILQPLMTQSLQNTQQFGPTKALTGPIVRGDMETLEAHIEAITTQDPEHLAVYKTLGKVATGLAEQQARLDRDRLKAIAALFTE